MRKILKTSEIDQLRQLAGIGSDELQNVEKHIYLKLGPGKILLVFHFIDIPKVVRRDSKIFIYCSTEHLIYVTDNKECVRVAGAIDGALDNYCQLLAFFIALCADDLHELERVEDKITKLEDMLLTKMSRLEDGPGKIIAVRRELLHIKRYYEQLGLIVGELADDENDILPQNIEARYTAFSRRITYLLNFTLHLHEYITQVREAYQAQLDIQQNQIMKVFTVISGVFMPLTLIVGWYGMNLRMPEFGWDFGYILVIALCAVVTVVCLALFKIKKWF
jgi:magnesium transporter